MEVVAEHSEETGMFLEHSHGETTDLAFPLLVVAALGFSFLGHRRKGWIVAFNPP